MPPGLIGGPSAVQSPVAPGRAYRLNSGLRSVKSATTYTRLYGNHDVPGQVLHVIEFDSTTANKGAIDGGVVAGQLLYSWIATFPGKVGAIKFYATDIAIGTGNTVMDVQIGGTSVWTNTSEYPYLDARMSGEFANSRPDRGAFQQGALIQIKCLSISTTGHKLCGTVDILAP